MKLKNVLALGAVVGISYLAGEIAGIIRMTDSANKSLKEHQLRVAAVIIEPLKGKCTVEVSRLADENEEDSQ